MIRLPRLRKKLSLRRTTAAFALSTRRDLELLELRNLLSADSLFDLPTVSPAVEALATSASPQGYTPAQIQAAYHFNSIVFNGAIQGNGAGQTIAIVDAYNHPNIASDLHVFDTTFGIADPPSFKVMNQTGGSSLPATNASWGQEIALDVEWAHAMAPGANIILVEANSSSITDLMTAVNTARNLPGVSVVSMSWGAGEFSSEKQYDSYFTTPAGHTGVTFIASAGDNGAQALWPAISPNVLSVGGTSLSVNSSGYSGESAWSASGGGTSRFESRPSYQASVQSSNARTSPDVSYNANPNTGFAVYDSLAYNGRSGWFEIGGTSAGAPQWAALLAIANQGRVLAGEGTLSGAQSNLYGLPSTDFHDITIGSNGNAAKTGYDLVTGRGTPIADLIVRDLVANTSVSTTPTAPTQNPTTPTQPTAPRTTQYYLIYWNHHWWLIPISSAAAAADTASPDDPEAVATANAITVSASLGQDGSQSTEAHSVVTVAVGQAVTTPASAEIASPFQSNSGTSRTTDTLLGDSAGDDAVDGAGYLASANGAASGDERSSRSSSTSREIRTQRSQSRFDANLWDSAAGRDVDLTARLIAAYFDELAGGDAGTEVAQPAMATACAHEVVDSCFADEDWSADFADVAQADNGMQTLLLATSLLAAGAVLGGRCPTKTLEHANTRGLLTATTRRPRRRFQR